MRLRTKRNLFIAACYAAAMILGMAIGPKFSKENSNSKNGSFIPFGFPGRSDKIDEILQIIDQKYVDPVGVDTLQNLGIDAVLRKLDPHSRYLPPEQARFLEEDLEGNFNGIGIEYYILNDTILITKINPGGPADKAGLVRGDQVLQIAHKNVAGINITAEEITKLIRGKRGSSLDMFLKRKNPDKTLELEVLRDQIVVSSIDAAYLLNDNTGYIKISRFGANTDQDFISSLETLQKKGMQNLVLDLRENGGGYVNAATELADQFLPDKKLIVYTQGKNDPRTDYFSTNKGVFQTGKLVILIDENTASASEIVAGAIQDLDRGTIIGRRSFGKGLVQEQFSFGDGSALNLTVARYYTPSGRSIQKSYRNGIEAYYSEVASRANSGELNSDGTHLADSLYEKNKIYKTSAGRVIYGGGGIMPDIFIPIDTAGYTDFYYAVNRKGILNDFLFLNLLKSKPPSSLESFANDFQLSDMEYKRLTAMALSRGIKFNPKQIELSKSLINHDIKALLARYYYGEEAFYKLLNADDRAIVRSIEVINGKDKEIGRLLMR